jgi:hypothetical protein
MISLTEHKVLFRTVIGLYALCFLLASEIMPELGDMFDLVPMPSDDVRNALLVYMAVDVACVVALERSIRYAVARLTR